MEESNKENFFPNGEIIEESTDSEGCGEGGLYDCPVHPQLNDIVNNIKYNLKSIPVDVLVAEVRRRQLENPLDGKVVVDTNHDVQFEITKLKWPPGVYHVSITCIEEEIQGGSSTSNCCYQNENKG